MEFSEHKFETIKLDYKEICSKSEDRIVVLTLNRPDKGNSFNQLMIKEIISALDIQKNKTNVRALIIKGAGKHFCGGADLEWMKQSITLSKQQNYDEAFELASLYETLSQIQIPTIAFVQGAAFGGGMGLVACCDIAIAEESTQFCLSEIKLGLIPATILPHIAKKLPQTKLMYYALTASPFTANQAQQDGFIVYSCKNDEANKVLKDVINKILSGSLEAHKKFKELHNKLSGQNTKDDNSILSLTSEYISNIRTTEAAQHGLSSFFNKTKPNWTLELDKDWTLI